MSAVPAVSMVAIAVMTGSTPYRTLLKMATGRVTKPLAARKLVMIVSSNDPMKAKIHEATIAGTSNRRVMSSQARGRLAPEAERGQLQFPWHPRNGRAGDEEHERQRQCDVDGDESLEPAEQAGPGEQRVERHRVGDAWDQEGRRARGTARRSARARTSGRGPGPRPSRRHGDQCRRHARPASAHSGVSHSSAARKRDVLAKSPGGRREADELSLETTAATRRRSAPP